MLPLPHFQVSFERIGRPVIDHIYPFKIKVLMKNSIDMWGYKFEAMDGNVRAAQILGDAGIPVAFKSDHPVLTAVSGLRSLFPLHWVAINLTCRYESISLHSKISFMRLPKLITMV